MALYGLGLLIAFGCLLSLLRWRDGIYMMIVVAAVQDPIRKLVPGAPGYLALACAPILVVSVLTMMNRHGGWWRQFSGSNEGVARAMAFLVVACLPAAWISASYGPGSWILTLLGIFSYGVLLIAIILGFHLIRSVQNLRRVLAFYCIATSLMLSGGVIEYFDLLPGSALIGTEALGTTWVRYKPGYVVDLIAGFYRSPDVMGWHAAAAAMLSMILWATSRGSRRWWWFALGGAAVVALLLCGRRKMVYMLPFFALAVGAMYWLAARRGRWLARVFVVAFPLLMIGAVGDWLGDESTQVRYYTEDPGDTLDQVETHGFGSVFETFQQSGFFGAGLGVATPGSHHLDVARPRVWQESTPSRIMVELGVPGLLGLAGLVLILLRDAWRVTRAQLRTASPTAPYAAGLFGFFLANAGSLVVSGQILADAFIATFLGISVGIVLSFRVLATRSGRR